MTQRWFHGPLLALLIAAGPALAEEDIKASEKLFKEKVAEILELNCVRCHNATTFKGKLSLESYDAAMKGGDSGEVIIAGESAQSLLVEMISGDKPEMPAKTDPLTKEEVALIRKWIDTGAGWPVGMKLKEKTKKTSWRGSIRRSSTHWMNSGSARRSTVSRAPGCARKA